MKNHRVVLLLAILVTCVLVISCTTEPGPSVGNEVRQTTWSIIKSPNTGKCYEVATQKQDHIALKLGHGYMGMAEIDCSFFEAQQ